MTSEERLPRAPGPGAAAELPTAQGAQPDGGPTSRRPGPFREARLQLTGEPTSAARARRFVSGVLQHWHLPAMAGGDTELLTSELVGNAIRHGLSPFTVIVRYDGSHVRVEVGDGSPALPRRLQPGPEATGGRGIQIVDDVASGWGTVQTVDGKRVWFELPVPTE